jgi:hypothetical protein
MSLLERPCQFLPTLDPRLAGGHRMNFVWHPRYLGSKHRYFLRGTGIGDHGVGINRRHCSDLARLIFIQWG